MPFDASKLTRNKDNNIIRIYSEITLFHLKTFSDIKHDKGLELSVTYKNLNFLYSNNASIIRMLTFTFAEDHPRYFGQNNK